ncbi:hypothetical protein F5884DRAFT_813676 [Xylogone sp. PMI_703]|nr:hypothetical protein F5884DRAFT_813676 [Xylogone sp. PMI_703]
MYKRWRVGLGSTEWDVNISNLIYKGMPKLDIGVEYTSLDKPPPFYIARDIIRPKGLNSPWLINFQLSILCTWIRPLFQFRQYTGLDFHFYSDPDSGESSSPSSSPPGRLPSPPSGFENFVFWIKEVQADPVIGPRGQPIFYDSSGDDFSW